MAKIRSEETIGGRIYRVRAHNQLILKVFAEKLEISLSHAGEIELGRKNPSKMLIRHIANTFNVNEHWLRTGEGEMFSTNEDLLKMPGVTQVRPVPVIKGYAPAGDPRMPLEVRDQVIGYISIPHTPKDAIAVIVKGDSMAPTIKDGDYVIFVPAGSGDIENGNVIIIHNEWGELILKRFRKKDQKILLISDNPEYPAITPNYEYTIVGKVIEVIRRVRF